MASTEEIEAVVQRWENALSAHDAEALAACYAPDATLESPVATPMATWRLARKPGSRAEFSFGMGHSALVNG